MSIEAAERIVSIAGSLRTGNLSPARREVLVAEQRRLWDEEFLGRAFEEIEHDLWMVRRYP